MPYLGSTPPQTALSTGDLGDDIVTLAKLASGTDGEILTWDASGNPAAVAVGTSGHFLKSQGAGSVPVFAAAGGGVLVEMKNAALGTTVGGTTRIYPDNTIPQKTEGTEILTLAITPASSSNILVITANVMFEVNDNQNDSGIVFICQDAVTNSLAAVYEQQTVDKGGVMTCIHHMAAGTTSETTFRVRVGNQQTGTWTVNGTGDAGQLLGGVAATTLSIMEYTP